MLTLPYIIIKLNWKNFEPIFVKAIVFYDHTIEMIKQFKCIK